MKLSTLISHSAKLYSLMLRSPQASDLLASHYFRKRKYIGSNDRKFISESVFATLRMKLLSEISSSTFPVTNAFLHDILIISTTVTIIHNVNYYSEIFDPASIISKMNKQGSADFNDKMYQALLELEVLSTDSAKQFAKTVIERLSSLDTRARNILTKNSDLTPEQQKLLENRYSMPLWLMKDWMDNPNQQRKWPHACQLADSMLFPAPLCLRVNTNMASVESVLRSLKDMGIDCRKGDLSPFSIIVLQRTDLRQSKLFKEGVIEVQDEGSQLISICLAPEDGANVLDACAGAGGKSLHIASLQNDSGNIIATDIELKKLKELNKRARRSGFESIRTLLANKKLEDNIRLESFDSVLIDAPCSGSGTMRRSPIQKWRLNRSMISKIAKKQLRLLNDYSRYVKPGGVLLYATCSILPMENDIVVNRFLDNNGDFSGFPVKSAMEKYNVNIENINSSDFSVSLTPHEHNTDGFYMAKMIKKGD